MRIFGSTDIPNSDDRKNPWYQLEVISQWDWVSKSVCYRETQVFGGATIYYKLNLITPIDENTQRKEAVLDLTEEMKSEINKMGFKLMEQ